jgi:DNA-directed RNA polymerase subunit RPC12/RpoP
MVPSERAGFEMVSGSNVDAIDPSLKVSSDFMLFFRSSERRLGASMIPEVFECPRCERQFVIDDVPEEGSEEVHCPQCSRFLGVRDIAFVLRSELDELIERLSYEKDRLEKDEAIYGLTDCDAEMKFYGREISRVIVVLRGALKELRHLREDYRVKN